MQKNYYNYISTRPVQSIKFWEIFGCPCRILTAVTYDISDVKVKVNVKVIS